ncbi:hypothetical protein DAI43_04775 [Achromobacter xylosoxidans]|nr:hypothetical protein DAI43_04775 [Achromobacter xylosoxidans]
MSSSPFWLSLLRPPSPLSAFQVGDLLRLLLDLAIERIIAGAQLLQRLALIGDTLHQILQIAHGHAGAHPAVVADDHQAVVPGTGNDLVLQHRLGRGGKGRRACGDQ